MDEIPNRTNVIVQLFRKGQRFAHQPPNSLPQRVVDALDMVRLAAVLADGTMPFGRKHFPIRLPEVAVADGALPIHGGQGGPKHARCVPISCTNRYTDDFPRVAIEREP